MAFTTVTGSNGVTSLVGTTGIDVATIVTLSENVFVGGNTANDNLTIALATGNNVASAYNVRMGGGDDTTTINNSLLNSFISLDGETIANDGNDTINTGTNLIINSEIVGRGGNDVFNGMRLNGSTVNGNTGDDTINVGNSSASFVYGGQGIDTITTAGNSSSVLINGNKGSDTITLTGSFATGSVYGGNGNDTITATLVVDAAGNAIDSRAAGILLSGDLGDDIIAGTTGIDTINGGDGSDTLGGNTGADIISGGAGNDSITGGGGGDNISGGAGNDLFTVLNGQSNVTNGSPSTGFDSITDFAANTGIAGRVNGDRINFRTAANAAIAVAAYQQNVNFTTGGANLLADLAGSEARDGGFTAGATNVFGVTITGAVAWAGSYVVLDSNGDNTVTADDTIIKLNTLGNIALETFNV